MKHIGLCLILILVSVSCGNKVPDGFCIPNVRQGDLDLRVSFVRGSVYKYSFEVCRAPYEIRNIRFTVYGAMNEGQIGSLNLNTSYRLRNVDGGIRTGDTFEVDFNSGAGDIWFVIYEDSGYMLDDSHEIIRGDLRTIF